MRKFLKWCCFALLLLLAPVGALAVGFPSIYGGSAAGAVMMWLDSLGNSEAVSSGSPLPIIRGASTPITGTGQNGISLASAQHLTVPSGAAAAEVTFEGAQVRCTTDGTTPTATVGTPYNPLDHVFPRGASMAALQCVGVSTGATFDAEYFK